MASPGHDERTPDHEAPASGPVGLVAIGRNEGERLRRCLESAVGHATAIVYVDSGSDDDSLEIARELRVDVIELDLSVPFTAARARNAGWRRLLDEHPEVALIQFVDGDCEIAADWLEIAARTLGEQRDVGIVCGRRRERFPERTVYNKLCDIEWDTPLGDAWFCGGDALMRATVLREADGFDPALIAGEEPELCFRVRHSGWRILRLDAEMTHHDAAMTRGIQWWRRNLRAGHAYAENAWMHAPAPDRLGARETRSNWFWGVALPAVAVGLAWPSSGLSALLLLAYPVLYARVQRHTRGRGYDGRAAHLYAASCVFGKLPQALGQLKFHVDRRRGGRRRLIEYK